MGVFFLLVLGIFLLWIGTELTVHNASRIARGFNVSELFIGLTILAFGSDLPELVVAVNGAISTLNGSDTSDVIMGNAVGSSISQISLIIGVTGLVHVLRVSKEHVRHITIELLGSVILVFLVAMDGKITWNDGAILLCTFLIYFSTLVLREKKAYDRKYTKREKISGQSAKQIALLIIGLAVVGYGSEIALDNAIILSEYWGIEQSFVGAIILGFGTSLPELAICINAALNKKINLSVGNVIGSNIFDLLVPVGVAAVIADISIDFYILWYDLPVLFFISIVVIWFLVTKRGLQKWEGIGLMLLYIGYAIAKNYMS